MSESYQGVKFNTVMLGEEIPQHDFLPGLKHWCALFHELGLAPAYPGGSYGNLSFRIREGENAFIITGTGTSLEDCSGDDRFVEVADYDPTSNTIYARGARCPSSESILHFSLYAERPEINAVFHGHSPEILGAAPSLGIPVTEKEEPYGSSELALAVVQLAKHTPFLIARNHGFFSLGKGLEDAGTQTLDVLMQTHPNIK